MRRVDVRIPAADGHSNGTLHVPAGAGPWPGVLAVAGDASSPHLAAGHITAAVYVAGARNDRTFTTEQSALLEAALADAGVEHTIEFYPARHGFAVPDNPTFDTQASERHWAALGGLYRARLNQS
jgi:carboxymethylenebutenolidase